MKSIPMKRRHAFTLLELLFVLTLIGVLIGLLLGAVSKARQMADQIGCQNHLKQILLGNTLWTADNPVMTSGRLLLSHNTPYPGIMETTGYIIQLGSPEDPWKITYPIVPMFRCPSDPTWKTEWQWEGSTIRCMTSYPFNALVYKEGNHLPNSITDGLSNTIGFTERYSNIRTSYFDVTLAGGLVEKEGMRPASFAYQMLEDALPVNDSVTNKCLGSTNGVTFYARPNPMDCPVGNPVSSHGSLLPAGFLDGSVRMVSVGVSPAVFWAQVTPASGD